VRTDLNDLKTVIRY